MPSDIKSNSPQGTSRESGGYKRQHSNNGEIFEKKETFVEKRLKLKMAKKAKIWRETKNGRGKEKEQVKREGRRGEDTTKEGVIGSGCRWK